jgi:hypothetical protein
VGYYGNEEVYEKVKGAKVFTVEAASDAPVALVFEDGRKLILALDGDCCSSSYYSDPEQFDELIGTTIQEIEEVSGKSHEGLPDNDGLDSCTLWSFLKFTTNKGHVTIDWRNDSNGYYSGSVAPRLVE